MKFDHSFAPAISTTRFTTTNEVSQPGRADHPTIADSGPWNLPKPEHPGRSLFAALDGPADLVGTPQQPIVARFEFTHGIYSYMTLR
jgi:hypothetical protein